MIFWYIFSVIESIHGLNYNNIYDVMTFVTPKNHIVFLIISYSGFRPAAFFESLSLSPSSSSLNIRRSRRRQVLCSQYCTTQEFFLHFPFRFTLKLSRWKSKACFLPCFSVSFQCPPPGSKQQQRFGVSWRRKSRLFWDFRTAIAWVYRLGGFFEEWSTLRLLGFLTSS